MASTEDLSKFDLASSKGRELEFLGYCSGRHVVQFNALRVAWVSRKIVNGKEEKFNTLEYSITGIPGTNSHAALHGDSGSLLFDPGENLVVGMLFAGAKTNQIAYFTRIDELREDILRHTGGADMRMYGA